jgi:hypothetical protein
VLHGALESRVPSPDLWKCNNYYSEAAIAARNPHPVQVKGGANVSSRAYTSSNKRASMVESNMLVSTVTAAQKEGGKVRGKGAAGGKKVGLGGKGGKAIVMPKGSVSEEILFGTIALLAEALGVHTMNALLIAGKKDDDGHVEGDRDDESMSALDKIFRFGLNPYLCASLHVVVKAIPRILTGVQGTFSPWDCE